MTNSETFSHEIARRQASAEPFAIATVVRTLAATAAKPGAKALLDEKGTIIAGFLGGGCVRGAIGRAAVEAIETGTPRLISLKPQDLLEADGIEAGEEREGIKYARNGCPSRGSMDIFVEPVLPKPRLIICGGSEVARALALLAERFDFQRVICAKPLEDMPKVDQSVAHFDADPVWERPAYVVIATQGAGDEAALRRALESPAHHIAFVGSRRKFATLSDKLRADGMTEAALAKVKAPAGLDIKAITPDEIALSILAEIIAIRREKNNLELSQWSNS